MPTRSLSAGWMFELGPRDWPVLSECSHAAKTKASHDFMSTQICQLSVNFPSTVTVVWWAQITSLWSSKDRCRLFSMFSPGWSNWRKAKRFDLFFSEPPWICLNSHFFEIFHITATFGEEILIVSKCWLHWFGWRFSSRPCEWFFFRPHSDRNWMDGYWMMTSNWLAKLLMAHTHTVLAF